MMDKNNSSDFTIKLALEILRLWQLYHESYNNIHIIWFNTITLRTDYLELDRVRITTIRRHRS